ncbi:glycosyl transferase group 1 [Bordetella flabilis]|uniref:Glycosyl transferase group 1 n=1 Tax=Bordetella flabilis TaxID=463014 RepID=A0A193GJ99_9BORD|nr:glycosyl transferase group 1 [Bordetella flabilis]
MWRIRAAARYGREHGVIALVRRSLLAVRRSEGLTRRRPLEGLSFLQQRHVGTPPRPGEVAPESVNWFIPLVGRGSGGHLNIFRFIHMLEQEGYDCRIVIADRAPYMTADDVRAEIQAWFMPLRAAVYMSPDEAPAAAISIATGWQTAYYLRAFHRTLYKCYFVQDYEPWFYAAGDVASLAEDTYRFGFIGITAGYWLADKLRHDFAMETHPVGFSCDRRLYRPTSSSADKVAGPKRIFFYARPATPRRGFALGVAVLAEVVRRLPQTIVVFAGSDLAAYEIPFPHENKGVMDVQDLPHVYGQCDAALVLSFSNVSLLPLELMACGIPVVSNRAPQTEWLLNDSNAKLARPNVDDLANAICTVLTDAGEAKRLSVGGRAAAEATDWELEGRRMSSYLRALTRKR